MLERVTFERRRFVVDAAAGRAGRPGSPARQEELGMDTKRKLRAPGRPSSARLFGHADEGVDEVRAERDRRRELGSVGRR